MYNLHNHRVGQQIYYTPTLIVRFEMIVCLSRTARSEKNFKIQ